MCFCMGHLTVRKPTSYMLVITFRYKPPSSQSVLEMDMMGIFSGIYSLRTYTHFWRTARRQVGSTPRSLNHNKNTGSVLTFVDNFFATINISLLLKKKKK